MKGPGGEVEEELGGEAKVRSLGEPVANFDGHERLETELLQGAMGLERRGSRQAKGRRHLRADELEDARVSFCGREREQPLGERRRGGLGIEGDGGAILEPEALTLEGVGGQGNAASLGEDGAPIEGAAPRVELTEGEEEP